MSKEVYYKILQLNKNASKEQIKRSYRELAKKYHPDVAKNAEAEKYFILIKEAYETLYFDLPVKTANKTTSSPEKDEEVSPEELKRNKMKEVTRKRAQQRRRKELAYYRKIVAVFKPFVWFGLFFNFLLAADYILPCSTKKLEITQVNYYTSNFFETNVLAECRYFSVHWKGGNMMLKDQVFKRGEEGESILLERSAILQVPIRVRKETDRKWNEPEFSNFTFFWWLIPSVLLLAVLLIKKANTSQKILGFCTLILCFFSLQLIIYIISA